MGYTHLSVAEAAAVAAAATPEAVAGVAAKEARWQPLFLRAHQDGGKLQECPQAPVKSVMYLERR